MTDDCCGTDVMMNGVCGYVTQPTGVAHCPRHQLQVHSVQPAPPLHQHYPDWLQRLPFSVGQPLRDRCAMGGDDDDGTGWCLPEGRRHFV